MIRAAFVLVLLLAQLNPWIERPVPEAQQWQWHLENEQRQQQIEQLERLNQLQEQQLRQQQSGSPPGPQRDPDDE